MPQRSWELFCHQRQCLLKRCPMPSVCVVVCRPNAGTSCPGLQHNQEPPSLNTLHGRLPWATRASVCVMWDIASEWFEQSRPMRPRRPTDQEPAHESAEKPPKSLSRTRPQVRQHPPMRTGRRKRAGAARACARAFPRRHDTAWLPAHHHRPHGPPACMCKDTAPCTCLFFRRDGPHVVSLPQPGRRVPVLFGMQLMMARVTSIRHRSAWGA